MFFSFINLGCTKNLVDTQFLLGRILEKRPEDFYYGVDPFSPEVELVFLNTCGFISSGRNEMFQTIKKLLRKNKKVCLLGCAVQYFEKLAIQAQLQDHETQERNLLKENPNLIFLSRAALAHFDPSMLEKNSSIIKNVVEQSEAEGHKEAFLNISTTSLDEGEISVHKSSLIKGGAEQGEAEGYMRFLPYNPDLKEKAKTLRNNLTKAEKKLRFEYLKDCEKKVLKQHPIDNYIVDFYIATNKLVIELDGDSHYEHGAEAYDKKRTEILESYGLKVLRFTNEEIFQNFDAVIEKIEEHCIEIPPAPLIEGGTINIESSFIKRGAKQGEAEGYRANSITDFSNDHFQRPKNSRAYTNIDLGFEYLKIAEGCNNSCAFCIIPKIRGKQVSLSIEELVQESKNLISQGVKELILIAQDSTRYGVDLYGKAQLFELLEAIDQIEGDFRYRVLYLYPDILTKKHLERLTKLTKFIPYFDLPLQHASPKILKLMGRFYNHEMTLQLLDFIKSNFEEYYIRTNFIVGFPGETEEDFRLLMDFIEQDWFDNIALFEYHDEPLASSSQLPDKVDPKVMRNRFQQAKKLVNSLYDAREVAQKGKEKIGTITDIRTTSKGERAFAVRPILHCPEIDSEDEISMEQILESLDGQDLKVGSEIAYIV